MSDSLSREVKKTLQKPHVHREWENAYRTAENGKFYDMAFDYIADVLKAPANSTLLDAGCGIGDYSLRLARHGFSVTSVDFSESVLRDAEANIMSSGLQHRITLRREDLLSLRFPVETFDYVLCWGVLMHIPEVDLAIAELCRVLKKGGTLVISESNRDSLQAKVLRKLKTFLGREEDRVLETTAGLEFWATTSHGELLTRQADIRWLKEKFRSSGLTVKSHVAGQFTELYCWFSNRFIIRLIHAFNNLWFRYIKSPDLAFGNILILEKNS